MSFGNERRVHCRYAYKSWVAVSDIGTNNYLQAADLSLGGLFVGSTRSPGLGTAVDLQLVGQTGDQPIAIRGVVVRREEQRGFAVKFSSMSERSIDRLIDLVDDLELQARAKSRRAPQLCRFSKVA